MSTDGLRVAMTGAAGYLGVELAVRSVATGATLLGMDIRLPPGGWPAEAAFEQQDVTNPSLVAKLQAFEPDVLVHLAWIFDPIHDLDRERRVDIEGTHNAFAAAAAAGVRRIVYPSSTTSYGLGPDRTQPYRESDESVPNERYPYGRFKAEIENWLPDFRAEHPDIDVVVPRACIVMGRNARNIVTHITRWPVMFRVAGHNPPMQFMHEQDAVDMMWWAMTDAPAATFNAAGRGVVMYKEVCRLAGRPCVALPAAVLYPFVALAWRLRLLGFPPGLLDYIRYPWVGDTSLMTEELGFRPRHSGREALLAYVEHVAGRGD